MVTLNNYYLLTRRKQMRVKRIWLLIKLLFVITSLSLLWWKYTCHKAYSDYSGETANEGITAKIFNFISKE